MLTADAFSHSARSFALQRPPVYIGYQLCLARSISTTSLSGCVCLPAFILLPADGDFLTSFSQVLACASVFFSYRLCRAELSTHVFTSVLLSCLSLFSNRRRATEFLFTGSINYCVLLYPSIHNPNQANWPLYFFNREPSHICLLPVFVNCVSLLFSLLLLLFSFVFRSTNS